MQELDILEPVLRDRLCDENGRVMGWCLSQGKTSTEYVDVRLEIPLEPVLLEKVEAALRTNRALERAASPPRLITHLLVDDRTGLPWKQRAFITCWKRVLTHAADRTGRERMRDLVWHDLRSIEEMLRVYGPVDPTITANAIVASLEPRPKREDQADRSNKPA